MSIIPAPTFISLVTDQSSQSMGQDIVEIEKQVSTKTVYSAITRKHEFHRTQMGRMRVFKSAYYKLIIAMAITFGTFICASFICQSMNPNFVTISVGTTLVVHFLVILFSLKAKIDFSDGRNTDSLLFGTLVTNVYLIFCSLLCIYYAEYTMAQIHYIAIGSVQIVLILILQAMFTQTIFGGWVRRRNRFRNLKVGLTILYLLNVMLFLWLYGVQYYLDTIKPSKGIRFHYPKI